jgi:CubicO group peptidase (beta-lactamase class C family)
MVSQQAEASYDELLAERITRPLGMDNTRVALSDSMKARLAKPYAAYGTPAANWDFADMPGAGGIRSSMRDMIQFAKACLDPPDNETGQAMQLAWEKHRDGVAGEPAMGLGWHLAGDASTRWHNGGTGGYHSMVMVNRKIRAAVVLLANTSNMELDALAGDVIRMLAGADVEPRKFEESIQVAPKVMQRYVGRYELAPTFVFSVSIQAGKLMVGVTNQPTVQVYPRSETEWFYKIVDATLTFKMNKAGKCQALELFQNGVRQMAKRIE